MFDRDHEIVGFKVAELQVGIPGDPEKVMAFDAHSWKEQTEIEGNHLLKRHCCVHWLGIRAAKLNGNRDKARKDLLRNLHSGQLALTRLWVMDQGGHVEAEIANERKGMGRIYR